MTVAYFVGVLVLLALGALLTRWWWRRDTRQMLDEFVRVFPGRCPVCSYHRYGITHGHVAPGSPVPDHACVPITGDAEEDA